MVAGPAGPIALPLMSLDVRLITADEAPAWGNAKNIGFLRAVDGFDVDAAGQALLLDRTWAGFDDDRVVSTLRSFPVELSLPGGGRIGADAVTGVTTSVTHRRRGLASRMVAADLAAARDRGDACAVLIAAEWPIYGRFGYGPATEHQQLTVLADARMIDPPGPESGTTEHIDKQTSRRLAPGIHDAQQWRSAGEITRDDRAWDVRFGLLELPGMPEVKANFHVLARDPAGEPIGLVRYSVTEKESHRLPTYELSVIELSAATPAAEKLLWHHLLSVDWAATITAGDRPVDELLPWWLANARQAYPADRSDFLWLRPLDVPALLTSRGYQAQGSVVIEVADPLSLASGRYLLDAGPAGASCTPTDRSAELTLTPAALGSVLLGGYSLGSWHAAGLVDEHRAGAAAGAAALLSTARAPYCSTWF